MVIVARGAEKLKHAREAMRREGKNVTSLMLDVTGARAVEVAVRRIWPVQVLVNCAGARRPSLLAETRDEDLDAVININVKAAFYLSRAVAGGLRSSRLTEASSTCRRRWATSAVRSAQCTARQSRRWRKWWKPSLGNWAATAALHHLALVNACLSSVGVPSK